MDFRKTIKSIIENDFRKNSVQTITPPELFSIFNNIADNFYKSVEELGKQFLRLKFNNCTVIFTYNKKTDNKYFTVKCFGEEWQSLPLDLLFVPFQSFKKNNEALFEELVVSLQENNFCIKLK